jgi:hypothetical protein
MDELDKLQEAKWTPTVDVFIQVSYTKIYEIDTINQRFQAEAIIESKWHDPSVTSADDKIDTDEIWTPGLYIDNAIKDLHEDISYKIVPDRVSKKFLICEMRKVRGIFWENLELENFPLVNELLIVIIQYAHRLFHEPSFWRTEPNYALSIRQKMFDLPKVRFGTVREKVYARTVYTYMFFVLSFRVCVC